jgi:hypothetical protein
MNNSFAQNNFKTVQQQNIRTSTDDMGGLEALFATGGVVMLIGFLIFVLWIWSMISMISLSGRFRDFLDEYRMNQSGGAREYQDIPVEDHLSAKRLSTIPVEESVSTGGPESEAETEVPATRSFSLGIVSRTSKILLGVVGILIVVLLIVLQVYR